MVSSSFLSLSETENGYVVQQSGTGSAKALLVTHAGTCEIVDAEKSGAGRSAKPIAGVIGVIHLHSNHYLITANGASEMGTVYGDKKIYKVTTFSVLPLNSTRYKVDEDENRYLDLLKQHLDAASLLFSYNYDLTKPFDRQTEPACDTEFMWNHFVSQELFKLASVDPDANAFILPFVFGYAKFVRTHVNMKPVTFGLITRRSRFRAGTRYFKRGINEDGFVANFNETEQLLVVHGEKTDNVHSYVQTRGSVPVFWAEMNNLKYKPNLLLGPTDYAPTRQHFNRTIDKYGVHYLVNLVNQKGYEKPVKQAYENAVIALNDPKLKYTYFDFHHECKKMRWHRVQLLIDRLHELGLSQTDYTRVSVGDGVFETVKKQTHVVRTNCMDCLDRTNVVQSTLGRWYLQQQLIDAAVIDGTQDWEKIDPRFNLVFMNIWADNADVVSTSYSGTGALKTDFTRTGQRTKKGALNDLMNSIVRYVKNNYRDGSRQDGFDLFLGNVAPYEITTSPFQDLRPGWTQAVPYSLFVCLVIGFTTLIFPKGPVFSAANTQTLIIVLGLASFMLKYIIDNGPQYVNWPKLCPLDFLVARESFQSGKPSGIVFEKAEAYDGFSEVAKKE